MGVWLVSVVVSWLVAAGLLAALCRIRQVAHLVPPDWRLVVAAATLAHVAASALVYAPLVRMLQPRTSRPATCWLTALAGVLPGIGVLVWRGQNVDGAIAVARTPEGWLAGLFFLTAAGGFGLLRHERDPRLAALERQLEEAERRVAARPLVNP